MTTANTAQIPDKWCDLHAAGGCVAECSRLCLRERIEAIVQLLRLTNGKEVSPENVHQLRVWTRRTIAALQLFKGILPRSDRKWFQKRMKLLREAAGNVRDLDVLLIRYRDADDLSSPNILRKLSNDRRKAVQTMQRMTRRWIAKPRLKNRLAKMLQRTNSINVHFDEWAIAQLKRVTNRVMKKAPSSNSDYRSLHRFRIRLKQLRYTIEVVASELPAHYRTVLYPEVCETLTQLGNINDHVSAARLLRDKRSRAQRKGIRRKYRRLYAQEKKVAKQLQTEFLKHWTQSELSSWPVAG